MVSAYLEKIFLNILSLSLSGALTGALILVIHPLTERFFSKRWNYYICFVVMIRLLLPVQFTDFMPGGIRLDINGLGRSEQVYAEEERFEDENAVESTDESGNGNAAESMDESGSGNAAESMDESGSGNAAEGMGESGAGKALESTGESVTNILLWGGGIIWLAGAAAVLFGKMWSYRRFMLLIRKDACRVADRHIAVLTQSMAAKLHMQKMPPVYQSAAISGPVTVGLWKPVVVLPESGLRNRQEEDFVLQYQLILHHELVHVARRDLWFKWIYQLLLCIHWFNPVLYLIDRKMNMDCELSCDEAILGMLTQQGRRMYGNVLLDIAEQNAADMKSALTTTFITGNSELKRRLQNVITFKKTSMVKILMSVCVMAGTMFLTACGSVYLSDGSSREDAFDDDETFAGGDFFYNGWNDFLGVNKYDKEGEAYLAYDDAGLLAGADVSDKWQAYNYAGGSDGVSISRFELNGTETIRIIYAEEERDIEVTSEFDLQEGRFKLVHIAPDGSVSVINDTGEKNSKTVTVQAGRNVIKIAGQAASLKNVEISFSGLKERYFAHIYHSEEDEYAGQIMETVQNGTVEKDKFLECLYYMDEEVISEAFAGLLKQGTSFSDDELIDIFIYSDGKRSGDYLIEAIENRLTEPLSVEGIYALCPYLEEETTAALIKALPEEDVYEGFLECMPYLSEKKREECLLAYIEAGGKLSREQFDDIEMYLSRSAIEKLSEKLVED